ncbi:hypothetical protein LTR66_002930 [Elasticomyces elasticus]|nr:hypothetical protein LTR66_002930 [Elasticomyces elasticus]
MFRNRTNSQKPTEDLLKNFKAAFPQFGVNTGSATAALQGPTSLTNALDVAVHSRQFNDHHDIKDQDPTPHDPIEPWSFTSSGLTPSVLDPNSHAFNSFANQMHGYYTPTPGGTTLYHNQAGDLHTPGLFGLGTPLSLPTSESAMHVSQQAAAFQDFHQQPHLHSLQTQHPQFQNANPFAMDHRQTFAPHELSHHPQHFQHQHMGSTADDTSMGDMNLDIGMRHQHSPTVLFPTHMEDTMRSLPPQQSLEKFRYHVTLNAPTAMIKHTDEIPVTYLNKGQAYTVSVVDTAPEQPVAGPIRYRTFIRISFEDEQQRQRPGACWQLWKEGRGTNEAHQRGGKLQAVEFVDPLQNGGGDEFGRLRMELESASFDGFCITWSPSLNGATECAIAVRFNFLSTDFSHSKGVKGIPVRLCAKTELLNMQSPVSSRQSGAETCYCKVKLFRDHGAERKLSNDITHVKKTIDKLKQQIAQFESGIRDLGKRKRSGSISRGSVNQRPGKVQKHKRTWSMTSTGSSSGRVSAEEDLQIKLATLQDMFTSTRPASVLYLRGAEQDDPDLHPVRLSGEPQDLTKVESSESVIWEKQSAHTAGSSTVVSPTPSSRSMHSGGRRESGFVRKAPTPFAPPLRMSSDEWRNHPQTATADLQLSTPQQLASPPDQAVKVQTRSPTNGTLSGWIEALGVDYSYQPPPERVIKPVASFYIQPRITGKAPEDNYYRAVYLMQRTLKDFVTAVALKSNIEPTQVVRTVRISRAGLNILFDDESVHALREGQDMTAEFSELRPHTPALSQREWDSGPTDYQVDGDTGAIENVTTSGYELKLLF